jgi:hypothetical protein
MSSTAWNALLIGTTSRGGGSGVFGGSDETISSGIDLVTLACRGSSPEMLQRQYERGQIKPQSLS